MARVSIILPTYQRNASGQLARAIQSVLNQTFTDFELLVVDDGSIDGSKDTITSFCSADPRVIHIRFEENVGIPALTTVKALQRSSGEFIAWMFDDCEWYPAYLEKMITALDTHLDIGIAYARCEAIIGNQLSQVFGSAYDAEKLKKENYIPNVATVIRKKLFYSLGWHDPRIVALRNNDYDFWCRASAKTNFLFIPEVLTVEHGISLPDSLGNVYVVNTEITQKMLAIDRTEELHPDRIANCNPFLLPKELSLNKEQQEDYLYLILTFVIKRHKWDLLESLATLPICPDLDDISFSKDSLLAWWIDKDQKNRFDLQKQQTEYIEKQGKHIQKQAEYIQKQTEYIEEQAQYIQKIHNNTYFWFKRVCVKIMNLRFISRN